MVMPYTKPTENPEPTETVTVTAREMNDEEIQTLKKLSTRIESNRDGLNTLYERYREMYFMEDESKPKWSNVDEKDIAVTISPTARNEVVGMVRLLDTSEVHVKIKSKGVEYTHSDKIEAALKTMLRVSGEYRRARVESDANLSAVLYGPVTLYAESLDDVLVVNENNPYRKAQIEEIKRRTPFLIRTINAEQSYPDWGEFGLIAHKWKYEMQGSALKERWGVECKADMNYTVHDVYDCEFRLVYAEGITDPLFARTHGLTRIPVVQRYAGGSSLFFKPEQQMQSFLYAKAKSRLDKRENALLTAISTAINIRGLLGPAVAVNPDTAPETIEVTYVGGMRIIKADAKQIDEKVIDPVVFQWKQMLAELSGESTIYKQTLGESIGGSTFSGLAMLSSAGKLPLVDQKRAVEMAFRDIFLNILQRIKAESIENDLIPASEIPDDVDIDVTMEPKLPQDQLRNAQVATNLGSTVSREWKHSELLQISDSNAMQKQVEKELIRDAILQQIISNPELMMPMVQAAMGIRPPAAKAASPQIPSADLGGEATPMPTMPGMEQVPQTEPIIPQNERMA